MIWSNGNTPEIRVEYGRGHFLSRKPAISLKRGMIGPRLLLVTRKLHTRFRFVPKFTTLDDLERPFRTLFQITDVFRARHIKRTKIDNHTMSDENVDEQYSSFWQRKFMDIRIRGVSPIERGATWQWGCQEKCNYSPPLRWLFFPEISDSKAHVIIQRYSRYSFPRRLFNDPEMHDLEWPWIAISR